MMRGRGPVLRQTAPPSVWAKFANDVVLAEGEWVSARRLSEGDTLRSLRRAQPTVERLIIEEMIRTGIRGVVEVTAARDEAGLAWLYARLIPDEISIGEIS